MCECWDGGVVVARTATQTFASFPFNQYPTISLQAGRLAPSGPDVVPAAGMTVAAGNEVSFIASSTTDPTEGAQIYCGVVRPIFALISRRAQL